ncbi:MAG: LysR family transcriptional regulator [Myxococcota bacterium]
MAGMPVTDPTHRHPDDDPKVLDVTLLRYFVAAARSRSITAAAKALGVSQPTVTNAIMRLEDSLGTKLFHRERSGITVTETGEQLFGRAVHILDFMRATERLVTSLENDAVGELKIGCHESLGAYFLPGFLEHLWAHSPGIDVVLWNDTSASVTEAVLGRRVDFGLVVNPLPFPDAVVVELFGDAVDLFVRVPEGAPPPPACATSDPDEATRILREGRLIYADRVAQSHAIIDILAAEQRAPLRRLACGDLEMVKSLTLGGHGIGVLPRRVALYGQPGRLRRLHDGLPFFPDTISLVYRADLHKTAAATRVKDALVAYGRSLGSVAQAYGG